VWAIVTMFRSWGTSSRHRAMKAVQLVATFTGRRVSDMLPSQRDLFQPALNLTIADVALALTHAIVICSTTKNRPVHRHLPAWVGILVANTSDLTCCPLEALISYFRCLTENHDGPLSPQEPFFQHFNEETGQFNGTPLTTYDVRRATQQALGFIMGAGLEGHGSVYFRLLTANLLIECGLLVEEQNVFCDWSHNCRVTYAHQPNPLLVPIQRKVARLLSERSQVRFA
jgi:hypothetical protein